jgi:hypothetical protein
MDLLEYQGKQPFKKHGVPVPDGRHAATVPEAVEAAEELGFPVMIKAQVQIGGRGNAGGIKAADSSRATCPSRCSPTSRASRPCRARPWAPPGRSSPARGAPPRPRPRRSSEAEFACGRNPTQVSDIAAEILGERV